MNYKLEQLIKERDELNKQIKQLRKQEKSKIQLKDIVSGNVFTFCTSFNVVVLELGYKSGMFGLGGSDHKNPFTFFSDAPRTAQGMLNYLNENGSKLLGPLTTNFSKLPLKNKDMV